MRKEGLSRADSTVCCECMEGGQVGCREGLEEGRDCGQEEMLLWALRVLSARVG